MIPRVYGSSVAPYAACDRSSFRPPGFMTGTQTFPRGHEVKRSFFAGKVWCSPPSTKPMVSLPKGLAAATAGSRAIHFRFVTSAYSGRENSGQEPVLLFL